MPTIDRSTVSIRFSGQDLDPDELTRVLSYSTLESIRPQYHTRIHRGRSKSPIEKGIWSLGYGEIDSVDLELKIETLLNKLTDDLKVWHQIASQYKGNVFCGLFLDGWNRGFELSSELLEKLANRKLKIGFDIYSPVDTWDNSAESESRPT